MLHDSTRSLDKLIISSGLLQIVLSFAAGIGLSNIFPAYSEIWLWLPIILLGIAASVFCFLHSQLKCLHPILFIVPFFFFIGVLYVQPHFKTPDNPNHIYNQISNRQTVSLEGILAEMPSVTTSSFGIKTKLLIRLNLLHFAPNAAGQSMQPSQAVGLVQLKLKGHLPKSLKPGDRFLVKAIVSRVNTYSTPGVFNYKQFLANRSIWVNGWVNSPANIIELHEIKPSIFSSVINGLRYFPERIRYNISSFLDSKLSQPARGLYKAILIGDRSNVPLTVIENFTKAGCVHILAISGLHMSLLSLIIIASLNWLMKLSSRLILHIPVLKVAAGLALLPLIAYAFIAGFNTPVARALLMTIVFVMALLFDRPGSLITHILLAALILLIWKPTVLFTASFQLSFSAVLAISLIYPKIYYNLFPDREIASPNSSGKTLTSTQTTKLVEKLKEMPAKSRNYLFAGLTLTSAAMLGTMPILLFHFNRFSLVSPVSNLIVEPLVCFWALVLGIIGCVFIPISPWVAASIFQLGSYGLITAERICSFFASFSFSSIWMITPTPVEIFFYYLLLIILVIRSYDKTSRQRLWGQIILLLVGCSVLTLGFSYAIHLKKEISVSFLDVGQGSSTLLQLPNDKNILIDGGGAASDRFNVGQRVIAPFLWKKRIGRLDALIITHPHADHYNGLSFIMRRFLPKIIWVNGEQSLEDEYWELMKLAEKFYLETRIPSAGTYLFKSDDIRLVSISGSDNSHSNPATKAIDRSQNKNVNSNNQSLVLKLDAGTVSFLFPGDIDDAVEKSLVTDGKKLKADILLAAHHGSGSSSSPEFISAVDPDFIVISAGRNNPFKFPDQKTIDRVNQAGIKVYSTANDGTVTFTTREGKIMVNRYQIN
jgi:competence protein ComEC